VSGTPAPPQAFRSPHHPSIIQIIAKNSLNCRELVFWKLKSQKTSSSFSLHFYCALPFPEIGRGSQAKVILNLAEKGVGKQ
jgi:hypothetical protein